jgi:hypothetical protein
MVLAGDTLFLAGSPKVDRKKSYELLHRQIVDRYHAAPTFKEIEDTITGKNGGILYAVNKGDGMKVMEMDLESIPVFDGLIAADHRLYLSLKNGEVMCLRER